MPDARPVPARAAPKDWSRLTWSAIWDAGIVAVGALVWFRAGLADKPDSVDESAIYSQSYFAHRLILGNGDNPAWLDNVGLESGPRPKSLIGLMLRSAGFSKPGSD
jgi:hypothetical protein